jgi:hypothetical protein
MPPALDRDLEKFRQILEAPGTFEEGFSWASILAGFFVGLVMVPGSMYINLLAGQGVGPAAKWVTVILFLEIAKRAHRSLRQAQIFTLFYIAGAAVAMPFEGLLYQQFFVQSQAAIGQGMVDQIPLWYAPTDPKILATRNFFQAAWLPAIGLVLFKTILSRLDNTVLSYGLFKLASDVERLPFPMAPVGAQGMLALAEDMDDKGTGKTSWRWRAFSIGGFVGLIFGFLYLGLPTLTGALLGKTIRLFPIPFADWTGRTEGVLPAVATGLSFDVGQFILGMVMPFWAVVGSFVGLIVTFLLNPVLYWRHLLPSWQPGDSTVETNFKNTVDFYFSFGLGISLAVAFIGIFMIFQSLRKRRQEAREQQTVIAPPAGRGARPFSVIGLVYLVTTAIYIVVCGMLIDWHKGVMIVLVIYGFLYTPLISYVTARLEGMVGQALTIPLVREAGMILSGYQGIAVWFLPFPIHNYGIQTVFYRQAELTGTKFTSIWKSEIIIVPFVIVCSIVFAQFIWSLAPIPSANYPYTMEIWELTAKNNALLYSATTDGYSQFKDAFSVPLISIGLASGMSLFAILKVLGAPVFLLYGLVQGLNQTLPHSVVPQFIGALLGRFYLQRKLGDQWLKTVPIISAGYFCGAGLISVFCIGVMFLSKSVFKLPF